MSTDSRNLHWITHVSDVENHRGGLESRGEFIARNIAWWIKNRDKEDVCRKPYYEQFLNQFDIPFYIDETKIVGEVGAGPFGGVLQVCNLPAKKKVFIDYIQRELVDLDFCEWPEDATYVESAAEKIPLDDNSIDVLVSYNCLDHGWNIFDTLSECMRVSKLCFLAFDCRGDDENEIERRKTQGNIDHPQMIRYADIDAFLKKRDDINDIQLVDLGIRSFPVAVVIKNVEIDYAE